MAATSKAWTFATRTPSSSSFRQTWSGLGWRSCQMVLNKQAAIPVATPDDCIGAKFSVEEFGTITRRFFEYNDFEMKPKNYQMWYQTSPSSATLSQPNLHVVILNGRSLNKTVWMVRENFTISAIGLMRMMFRSGWSKLRTMMFMRMQQFNKLCDAVSEKKGANCIKLQCFCISLWVCIFCFSFGFMFDLINMVIHR